MYTDNRNGAASLKGKTPLEIPTADTSPVAIATDKHYTDQISLAGNISQTSIPSISGHNYELTQPFPKQD